MSEVKKYKILYVKTVEGTQLNPYWKGEMQLIETDKGEYIDNLEGITYGGFKGHNWKKEIGKTISAKVVESANRKWLHFIN